MNLFLKVILLLLSALLAGVAIFSWQNKALAPEMLLAVLTAFSILAIAAALIAIALSFQARRETAALSLLVENAVDRLEQRHDADNARLVMALAAFDARVPQASKRASLTTSLQVDFEEEQSKNNGLNISSLTTPKGKASAAVSKPSRMATDDQLISRLSQNQFPLSLEPIFEMPSATVRGYLAYAQIDGRNIRRPALLSPDDIAKFEYQLAFAAAKAARQLLTNENAAPIFCSISAASIVNLHHLEQVFEAQPDLKDSLVFLVAGEQIKRFTVSSLQQLKRAEIRIAIEGDYPHFDASMPISFSHLFVHAITILNDHAARNIQKFQELAKGGYNTIVALDSGDEAQLVQLIDLGVTMVTSQTLSSPRLIRAYST